MTKNAIKTKFSSWKLFYFKQKITFIAFLKQKRINNILCKSCKEKNGQQPVLWEVFNNFKTHNRADENIFKFRIFIEKNFFCNFLIKDFNFNENKIVEIYKN